MSIFYGLVQKSEALFDFLLSMEIPRIDIGIDIVDMIRVAVFQRARVYRKPRTVAKRDERHIGIERIYKCVHIGRACEKRRIRSARGARSVDAVSHAAAALEKRRKAHILGELDLAYIHIIFAGRDRRAVIFFAQRADGDGDFELFEHLFYALRRRRFEAVVFVDDYL